MLSDRDILDELHLGGIKIDPFNREQLGPNSYDVRLGEWVYRQLEILEESVEMVAYPNARVMWRSQPERAYSDGGLIVLAPGEMVLAHTEEAVGTFGRIFATMAAKSTAGRSGIEVCKCAGFGDVGFHSRWTMELTNIGKRAICIPVGARIAQLAFDRTESKPIESYQGRYQGEEWSPEMMLPAKEKENLSGS